MRFFLPLPPLIFTAVCLYTLATSKHHCSLSDSSLCTDQLWSSHLEQPENGSERRAPRNRTGWASGDGAFLFWS
jgi:hypothetical protein